MLPFINPLPIVITLAALLGVMFHDTQFDRAATNLLATPVTVSDFGSAETALRMNQDVHTHTERVAYASSQPSTQPRLIEDKKYIVSKRLVANFGDGYSWPSI